MNRFQSDPVEVAQSPKDVYSFLSDFENIGKLMPEQVENFNTDGQTCSFTIKGMATLGLSYAGKTPDSEIVMAKHGKAPFDFNLVCKISEGDAAGKSRLQLFLDSDMNPLMRMMAEKPLTNFLNLLVQKYSDLQKS
jgi:carbon monoxide dehydrogenase subunit G